MEISTPNTDLSYYVRVNKNTIGPYSVSTIRTMLGWGQLNESDPIYPENNPTDQTTVGNLFPGVNIFSPVHLSIPIQTPTLPFTRTRNWFVNVGDGYKDPHSLTTGQLVELIRAGDIPLSAKLWHRQLRTELDADFLVMPYGERVMFDRDGFTEEDELDYEANEHPAPFTIAETDLVEIDFGRVWLGPLTMSEARTMMGTGQLSGYDGVRPVGYGGKKPYRWPRLWTVAGEVPPSPFNTQDPSEPVLTLPFVTRHDWLITQDGKQEGPFSMTYGEIIAQIRKGEIDRAATLWHGGLNEPGYTGNEFTTYGFERGVYEREADAHITMWFPMMDIYYDPAMTADGLEEAIGEQNRIERDWRAKSQSDDAYWKFAGEMIDRRGFCL